MGEHFLLNLKKFFWNTWTQVILNRFEKYCSFTLISWRRRLYFKTEQQLQRSPLSSLNRWIFVHLMRTFFVLTLISYAKLAQTHLYYLYYGRTICVFTQLGTQVSFLVSFTLIYRILIFGTLLDCQTQYHTHTVYHLH